MTHSEFNKKLVELNEEYNPEQKRATEVYRTAMSPYTAAGKDNSGICMPYGANIEKKVLEEPSYLILSHRDGKEIWTVTEDKQKVLEAEDFREFTCLSDELEDLNTSVEGLPVDTMRSYRMNIRRHGYHNEVERLDGIQIVQLDAPEAPEKIKSLDELVEYVKFGCRIDPWDLKHRSGIIPTEENQKYAVYGVEGLVWGDGGLFFDKALYKKAIKSIQASKKRKASAEKKRAEAVAKMPKADKELAKYLRMTPLELMRGITYCFFKGVVGRVDYDSTTFRDLAGCVGSPFRRLVTIKGVLKANVYNKILRECRFYIKALSANRAKVIKYADSTIERGTGSVDQWEGVFLTMRRLSLDLEKISKHSEPLNPPKIEDLK